MARHNARPVWIALGANLAVFATKMMAALVSGSAAMSAEALHSLADTCNSIFLLVGLRAARKPADDDHPFGYGKEIYFWSFIASVFMLGVTSSGSIIKGINQLRHPVGLENYLVTFVAAGVAIVFETSAVYAAASGVLRELSIRETARWRVILRAFQGVSRVDNPSIKFVFYEDTVALTGVLLALLALLVVKFTGLVLADGMVSIVIGLLLATLALLLAGENRELIVGRAADDSIELRIGRAALQVEQVKDVHSLKTMQVGPACVLVNMEVEVNPDLKVEMADDVVEAVEMRIKEVVPAVEHCSIEVLADNQVRDWKEEDYQLPGPPGERD